MLEDHLLQDLGHRSPVGLDAADSGRPVHVGWLYGGGTDTAQGLERVDEAAGVWFRFDSLTVGYDNRERFGRFVDVIDVVVRGTCTFGRRWDGGGLVG